MNVDELFPYRVVSGFRPTRRIHLGHYGAVLSHVIRQQYVRAGAAYVFVADLHSLSAWDEQPVADADRDTIEVARQLIATGLDTEFCTIYVQSQIPEVLDIMWLLAGLASDAHLRKNPVFKQYSSPTAGVYLYPLLMVADIVAVRATHVAIGRDQRHHMELARGLTRKLLARFGPDLCPLPEYAVREPLLIRGTNTSVEESGTKMAADQRNDIPLFADEDTIQERIEHISTSTVEWGAPLPIENCNILHYASLLMTERDLDKLRSRYNSGSFGYRDAKKALVDAFFTCFQDQRERYRNLSDDYVRQVLRNGSMKARVTVSSFAEELRGLLHIA